MMDIAFVLLGAASIVLEGDVVRPVDADAPAAAPVKPGPASK